MPTWSVDTAPLGLATISGVLRGAGYEVKAFDFNVELWGNAEKFGVERDDWTRACFSSWADFSEFERLLQPRIHGWIREKMDEVARWCPDVAGFSIVNTAFPCSDASASILKKALPNIKIVFGGADILKEKLEIVDSLGKGEFDVAVIGEGEATVLELMKRLEGGEPLAGTKGIAHWSSGGELVFEEQRPLVKLAEQPFPCFDDFDLERYRERLLPILMSRGCTARCTFCSEGRVLQKFRSSEATRVFQELERGKSRYGIEWFAMADSLVNGNFAVLRDLVDLLVESDERFFLQGIARFDKRMTLEFLEKMALAGFSSVSYGLESASQRIMDLMEKRITTEIARDVLRNSHKAGMRVYLNVIVGFPGETEEEFRHTFEFLRENIESISGVLVNTLRIDLGTPLAREPQKFRIRTDAEGRYDLYDWVSDDEEGPNTLALRERRAQDLVSMLSAFPHVEVKYYNEFQTVPSDGESQSSGAIAAGRDGSSGSPRGQETPARDLIQAVVPSFIRWRFGQAEYSSSVSARSSDFSFRFEPVLDRKHRAFRDEMRAAAARINERRGKQKVALCVSGGIDSEAMALTLREMGVPFEMFFLNTWGLNDAGFPEWSDSFQSKFGSVVHEIKLTRAHYYEHLSLKIFREFGCEFPTYVALTYLFEQIPQDYFIVVGDGDLQRGKSALQLQEPVSAAALMKGRLLPFSRKNVFFYQWAMKNRRPGEFCFFSSTPGLLSSMMEHPKFEIARLVSDTREVIYAEFPEIQRRPKTTNWDTRLADRENKLARSWLRRQVQFRFKEMSFWEEYSSCLVDLNRIYRSETRSAVDLGI